MNFKVFVRGVKRLIISVIKNDFYGMAAEMGFMMVIGIFPFVFDGCFWLDGKQSFDGANFKILGNIYARAGDGFNFNCSF